MKTILCSLIVFLFSKVAFAEGQNTQYFQMPRYEFHGTLTKISETEALYVGEGVQKFNVKTSTWTDGKPMNIPRAGHAATLLKDGRLLVVGGFKDGKPVNTPEIYDPRSNSWIKGSPSSHVYRQGVIVQLPNSKVLAISRGDDHFNCTISQLFDPATLKWFDGDVAPSECQNLNAYTLPSGKIMFISGVNGFQASLYNPKTNNVELVSSPDGGGGYTGQLANGQVFALVAAHMATWKQKDELKVVTFDEKSQTWQQVGDIAHDRGVGDQDLGGAFGLSDGRIIVYSRREENKYYPYDGDVFDPKSNSWMNFDPSFSLNLSNGLFVLPLGKKLLLIPPNDGGGSLTVDIP